TGALVGSEGTLGIVTEVVLRVLRKPEATRTFFATFPSTDEAGNAVSRIIAAGIVPAAIEMMDRLAIVAIKAATGVDWPDVSAAVLREIEELATRAGLRIANVFHAGDGNLHPLVLYDARIHGQEELAEKVGGEILRACIRAGGSITGEHGVGADKAPYMGEL